MRRVSMVAMIVGGAFLVAHLPGLVRREPAPAAPVASATPVAAPAGPTAAPASGRHRINELMHSRATAPA